MYYEIVLAFHPEGVTVFDVKMCLPFTPKG
jgi:hypothetical protein